MNRQEGIHPCFIIAMCLDPRFKELKTAETGVKDVEREDIWKKVFELMVQEKSSVRTNNKNNTTTIGEEDNMEDNTGNNEGQAANVDDGNGNNVSDDFSVSSFLMKMVIPMHPHYHQLFWMKQTMHHPITQLKKYVS